MRSLVLTVLLAAAVPVQAGIVSVGYEGVLGAGSNDDAGLFGTAGASLVGEAVQILMTFDEATPGASLDYNNSFSALSGGAGSARITIKGVTQTLSSGTTGQSFAFKGADRINVSVTDQMDAAPMAPAYENNVYFYVEEVPTEIVQSVRFDTPLDVQVTDTMTFMGGFYFLRYDPRLQDYRLLAEGQLAGPGARIVQSYAAAVPEPPIFALLGIGWAGLVLVRRKQQPVRTRTVRLALIAAGLATVPAPAAATVYTLTIDGTLFGAESVDPAGLFGTPSSLDGARSRPC